MTRVSNRNSKTNARHWAVLFSCEHATNLIPRKWKFCFRNQSSVLASHRGWDLGTLQLGRFVQRQLGAELVRAQVSRLLVEMNRSLAHPTLFSEFSRELSPHEKQLLVDQYWTPYRSAVVSAIDRIHSKNDRVLHISLHSFTPKMDGKVRNADVGLLYDPGRQSEVAITRIWFDELKQIKPDLRVRRNYPYRGTADGLTKSLRKQYRDGEYSGIELEINQAIPLGPTAEWKKMIAIISNSLIATLRTLNSRK